MVKTDGAGSSEVKKAKEDFDRELAEAVLVVTKEKDKGKDISALSREVDEGFKDAKNMLKEAYRSYYEDLKEDKKELEKELRAALAAENASTTLVIQARLKHIADEQEISFKKEQDIEDDFEDEEDELDEIMGDQISSMSHMRNAERDRAQIFDLAKVHGVTINRQVLIDFDVMLSQAKASFGMGDFESAKEYADDARDILKDERDSINMQNLEDEMFENLKQEIHDDEQEDARGRDQKKGITDIEDDTLDFDDNLEEEIESMPIN
jgi:galactitol-specific phosphotransferase system IIB component